MSDKEWEKSGRDSKSRVGIESNEIVRRVVLGEVVGVSVDFYQMLEIFQKNFKNSVFLFRSG